ncbi:MAG TPA: LLM class flavin-dependent oxidoreductase [Pseudonocardia sp.]|jgi:phthiodiolone/phenolphthiodiolone dimycocerosates ketoreductase
MAPLKIGGSGVHMPPIELGQATAKAYEDQGLDFLCFYDQLNLTIPRSIWTPDIVPAAAVWDIDAWLEPWIAITAAALATERIEFFTICDALRRPPALLAQLALTMSHASKGRFTLFLGAGETKQFQPYGLPREKPFAHLEDSLEIIRKFFDSADPVDHQGPIWNLDRAIVGLRAYQDTPPTLCVAGGPGKAMRFAATLADGWMVYLPPSSSPEQYAEQVADLRRMGEQAGKDPDSLIVFAAMATIVGDTEQIVDQACANPALRWDAASLVPHAGAYERMTGKPNPLGDWSYPRDLIPMHISRERALEIADQVTANDVRKTRFAGTPHSVADQFQPYLDAGVTHVLIADYCGLVSTGSYSEAESSTAVADLVTEIRKRNPA